MIKKSIRALLLVTAMILVCSCAIGEESEEERYARLSQIKEKLDEVILIYPTSFASQEYVFDSAYGIPEDIVNNSSEYVSHPFFFTGSIAARDDALCAVQLDDRRIVYVFFKYYDSNRSVVELDQPIDASLTIPAGFFCTYWCSSGDMPVFINGVTQEIKGCTINYPMN